MPTLVIVDARLSLASPVVAGGDVTLQDFCQRGRLMLDISYLYYLSAKSLISHIPLSAVLAGNAIVLGVTHSSGAGRSSLRAHSSDKYWSEASVCAIHKGLRGTEKQAVCSCPERSLV